jgi:hypothetical protein
MIARILLAIALLFGSGSSKAYMDWSDLWFNPLESGWGVNLVQSYDFMFGTFFIYDANGLPTWYVAEMKWDDRILGFTGSLWATTGTGFALPWQSANSTATVVGTASFVPTQNAPHRGNLSYTFTGTTPTVTKPIQRQTLTSFELSGEYAGTQQGDYYDCAASPGNANYLDSFQLRVQRLDDLTRMTFDYEGGLTCTLTGVVEQYGSLHRIPLSPGAQYQCSDGLSTVANVYELKVTSLGVEGRIYAPSVANGCKEVAKFSAVYLTDFAAQ